MFLFILGVLRVALVEGRRGGSAFGYAVSPRTWRESGAGPAAPGRPYRPERSCQRATDGMVGNITCSCSNITNMTRLLLAIRPSPALLALSASQGRCLQHPYLVPVGARRTGCHETMLAPVLI